MKKSRLVLVLVICFGLSGLLFSRIINKTIATVNGEPILKSEFDRRVKSVTDQFGSIFTGDEGKEKLKDFKENVLDQLINEKLLLQEAKKKKIHVTEKEIEDGIAEVKSRFKTEDEFKEELKKQNLTERGFKSHIKEQIMVIKLIDLEVKSKIESPSESELKKFYEENRDKMVEPEQVRVRHILIKVDKDASKNERQKALTKIKGILLQAKKGKDFAELAKKYSEGPSASQGGDLGFFARGEMVKEFEDAAFSLKVGEISNIVKTKFGYHIIKCIGKKAKQKRDFEDVKDNIKSFLIQQKMGNKYEAWLRDLRDKAVISKTNIK